MVQSKHLPAGRTGLSNQFLGPVTQDQPGPVGQICPTSWLLLWLDSARPTTGRTRLFEHRSNCRVRPVNAGSAAVPLPDPSSHGFNACLNSPAGTRFALADLVDNNNNWLKPLDLDLGGGAMTRR
ncbi:hypothetical protein PCANC_01031 [Puccinia coronata f. sp. avenae]|uniref:Uncharacterized protein n=1 Tax=Puccinia coronata f. sp. avenae TaxID=200324 RepID=A0A2N5VIL6_9BASI|nr:hypothetical protein PCASD_01635 [Puccinia coronata f. sp. avenae]PLW57839.1 hypothetical protein PCANC_01031 [Puccinia coronata f. sp. avenae]